MDAIADTTIAQVPGLPSHATEDTPSLLAVVIETNPMFWTVLREKADLKEVIEAITVALNAHLSINNSNKVVVIAAHSNCARFVFPSPEPPKIDVVKKSGHVSGGQGNGTQSASMSPTPNVGETLAELKRHLKSKNIYRQFKLVDETVLDGLDSLFNDTVPDKSKTSSTVPGALSMALAYINRTWQINDGLSMSARMLVVSVCDDSSMSYIPTMNSIFAAQGMKIPIDVCKLGNDSTFLQQASDVTGGIYLLVADPRGLIQYLSTVFFIDPSIRNFVALPVNNDIDFRASCFMTGNIVDIGFVCSVCLCVLSAVPVDEKCPTCDSRFDPQALDKLKRKPVVNKKKVSTAANGNGSTVNTPSRANTPSVS